MSAGQVAEDSRRAFFTGLSSMAVLAFGACTASREIEDASSAEHGEEHEEGEEGAEVTPGEDLMQEHGVLERILLVYDEAIVRLNDGVRVDPTLLVSSATLVRKFVENYHEKSEELFVFPRLEKLGKQTELVATLKQQHLKGREVTAAILTTAGAPGSVDAPRLAGLLRSFVRMYRPHASREETVLFPAFRKTMDDDGYHELGERFEEREHKMFGKDGFDDAVARIAEIEVALGIHDLARFTPVL